jgi:hypothetical protein
MKLSTKITLYVCLFVVAATVFSIILAMRQSKANYKNRHPAPTKATSSMAVRSDDFYRKCAEQWIRDHASDETRVRITKWSDITINDGTDNPGSVLLNVQFRAPNGFGAIILEDRKFQFTPDGKVIWTSECNEWRHQLWSK